MNKWLLAPFREEILKCTNCGFCQTTCPVFEAALRPAYSPRGKMLILKEFIEGFIKPSADLAETFYTCTTCQACTQTCPRQIKAAEIVCEVRKNFYYQDLAPHEVASIGANISKSGNIFTGKKEERIDGYPLYLKQRIRLGKFPENAETLVFMGCLPSYLDMKIVPSLVNILERARIDYTTLGIEESCCGLPLYLMGSDEFEIQALRLMEKIRATGAKEIVTPCAGCYKTFTRLYPEIGEWECKVFHAVQYLESLILEDRLRLSRNREHRITYHDPCDLGRDCKIFESPRNILKAVPGLEMVEMKRNRLEARCCGGGGGLQAYRPELAREMAAKRIRDAIAVGADTLVSGCPACKDNLRKGARLIPKEEGGRIKIADICEVISERIT